MKSKVRIIFLFLLLYMLSGCESTKQNEIVWYIRDPAYYGIDETQYQPYEKLNSKRFDLFNQRLKELNIDATVTFKYYKNTNEENMYNDVQTYLKEDLRYQYQRVDRLIKKDPQADLVEFSFVEYQAFEPLDKYYPSNHKIYEVLPSKLLDANKVEGILYQLPKGNVSIRQTTYYFNEQFLKDCNLEIDEAISNKTIEEIIEMLIPYFEQNEKLSDSYYLTSFQDINPYFEYYSSMNPMSNDYGLCFDLKQHKVIHILESEEYLNIIKTCKKICNNNLDGHDYISNQQLLCAFYVNTIPTIKQLSSQEINTGYIDYGVDKSVLSYSLGNGVLKTSNDKALAAEVLAATMYDETLTNLMIYGVENEDYILDDGVVKSNQFVSSNGSFSQIGNNLIAYPNQMEVKNKKDITFSMIEKLKVNPYIPYELNQDDLDNLIEIESLLYAFDLDQELTLKQQIDGIKAKMKEYNVDELKQTLQKQWDERRK